MDPSSHTFDYKDLAVSVATNNKTGYQLTMSTASTSLINTVDNTLTIPTLDTLSGGYTTSTFQTNKWGYSKDSGNYFPFPASELLLQNTTATNGDNTDLRFATKIDYTQPSGTYKTTISFNAVTNPLVEYLQNWTGCSAMSIGDTTTLVDKRDNEEYLVGKLADNNCWTLENLRLDLSTVSLANLQGTTSAPNTNANNTTLTYLKNGGGSSPYPANGVIAKTASSGSWTNDYANPYIATQYENTTQAASGSSPAGKIGIYYNYCAASAGSHCYAANASSGDASQDICPAGWHLPTGGASGQYQALYTAYSSNVANFKAALSTPLSGYFVSGTAYLQGTLGYFWSSARSNGGNMYALNVNASAVNPQDNNGRVYGVSVRCVKN